MKRRLTLLAACALPALAAAQGALVDATASTSTATPPPEPRPSPDFEASLGALAGKGGAAAELYAAIGARHVSGGLLFTIGRGSHDTTALGVHVAGGPRLPLSPAIHLDLLVDAGIVIFDDAAIPNSGNPGTAGNGRNLVVPALGARAAITFRHAGSGMFVSLGPALRWLRPRTVQDPTCPSSAPCDPTIRYGGTIAGGFLAIGHASAGGR